MAPNISKWKALLHMIWRGILDLCDNTKRNDPFEGRWWYRLFTAMIDGQETEANSSRYDKNNFVNGRFNQVVRTKCVTVIRQRQLRPPQNVRNRQPNRLEIGSETYAYFLSMDMFSVCWFCWLCIECAWTCKPYRIFVYHLLAMRAYKLRMLPTCFVLDQWKRFVTGIASRILPNVNKIWREV